MPTVPHQAAESGLTGGQSSTAGVKEVLDNMQNFGIEIPQGYASAPPRCCLGGG